MKTKRKGTRGEHSTMLLEAVGYSAYTPSLGLKPLHRYKSAKMRVFVAFNPLQMALV